ncbi:MAG TPA: hypothetical protein PK286_07705 [Devosia sp.]|nr:hypothetical protein [Devosia sp.]
MSHSTLRNTESVRAPADGRPFLGLIDAVLIDGPAVFEFDGAIERRHAADAWGWILHDILPEFPRPIVGGIDAAALEALAPELLRRARHALALGSRNALAESRLKARLGGNDQLRRLSFILDAFEHRQGIAVARAVGRTLDGLGDAELERALRSLPRSEPKVFALLMQAVVAGTADPGRLTAAAAGIAESRAEGDLVRTGFAPLIDALLAHAQNQTGPLDQVGLYADFDHICGLIERFDSLIAAVTGQVEIGRDSRWSAALAGIIGTMSKRVRPLLRDVVPDINRALRRYRDGADQLDREQLLTALNAMYLLAAVHACRHSLDLGDVFDPIWMQVGKALELHVERNFDMLQDHPGDGVTSLRLDAAIKMTELRFNTAYAQVLREAKAAA